MWTILGNENGILNEKWPEFDKEAAKGEKVTLAIQINGKLRSKITVDADIDEGSLKDSVQADEKIIAWTAGKTISKIIVIPKKLVNIVLR